MAAHQTERQRGLLDWFYLKVFLDYLLDKGWIGVFLRFPGKGVGISQS